jgi:hypothetical protein
MDEGVLTEDVADRPQQRLAAVDHDQDRLGGVEAAIDQVGKQGAGELRVLGRALPEPERGLHPLGRDPERDYVGAVGHLHAVEHHHREAHIVEAPRHQLLQRRGGALSEHLETELFEVEVASASASSPTG